MLDIRRLSTLLIAIAATVPLTAQRARSGNDQSQPPLTFKVEVNYVEIDAAVTDAQGNPVRDLAKDDFQIVEEGKPQAITVFSRIEIPVDRPDPPLYRDPKAPPIEPDVRSNLREFDGRVFVLVLDDLHIGATRTARLRTAAAEFIQRYLGANDLAAVVYTGGSHARGQEFTTSRSLLLRAVNAFSGQKLRSSTIDATIHEGERALKARNLASSLKGVAEYLAGVRGRRKALVLFSEGIDYDINNPMQNRYASDIMGDLRLAIAAATRSNVSFYTVDPRGLTGFEDLTEMSAAPADNPGAFTAGLDELRRSQDSLRVLAEETGGLAVVNRNDYREAFARIIRENSSYYVLGYYSDNTRRDGRFRAVDVKVRRTGVVVRARKGYVAPRGNPATTRNAAAPGTSPELRDALASPLPVSGLGLRVAAAAFRGGSTQASVLLTLEIDGSRFRFTETDGKLSNQVEIVFVPFDASGKAHEGVRDEISMTPRPQLRDAIVARGVRILRRLELKSGRYQLRVGAREAGGGAVGSVLLDLEVPDFGKDPLTMSGIALTSSNADSVPTPRADEQLKDVLPAPPTLVREFTRGEELTLFAEVYDQLRTPHRVEIKTTVTADDGQVMFNHSDERRSDELRARGDGFGHVRTIPLKGFAPGRYVLRLEAKALVADAPTVFRELELTVR